MQAIKQNESSETNPQIHGQLIFNKNTQQRERTVPSRNSVGKAGHYIQRMRLTQYFLYSLMAEHNPESRRK